MYRFDGGKSIADFRIDDFIGDPDEQGTETYEDLLNLRKKLLVIRGCQ